MPNIYQECPVFTSQSYRLRLVAPSDAQALLEVYGDPEAVPYFNGDNCHGDTFYYPTLERVQQAIDFWQSSYREGYFVRWSIEELSTSRIIGTIELFDRTPDCGVLRLDLCHDCETTPIIRSILTTLYPSVLPYFTSRRVITKCWPYAPARRQALQSLGFTPANSDYWERVWG